MPLHDRLLRDLKASAPKTAILALVTGVGLYFWIPSFWGPVFGNGDGAVDTESAKPNGEPSTAVAISSKESQSVRGSSRLPWEKVETIRKTDPLFKEAHPTELRHDAFVLSNDYLPIEVEFAVDPPAPKPAVVEASNASESVATVEIDQAAGSELSPESAHGLTLRSTLIGGGGRKALINRRVYSEGEQVLANGRGWKLVEVNSRDVVLESDGETIDLRIAPFELKQAQVER